MPALSRLVAASLGALTAAHGVAQVVVTPWIVRDQPAPGSSGSFNAASSAAIQAPGRAAAFCFLINTPNPGFDSSGIWQSGPLVPGVSLMAIADGVVPGTGGRRLSALNNNGTQTRDGSLVFSGNLTAPFTNDGVLLFHSGGGLSVAVQEGDPAPSVPGGLFGSLGIEGVPEFAMGNLPHIAFITGMTGVGSNPRALFAGNPATRVYELLARNGNPSPLPGGAPFSFITNPSVNDRGDVAFFSNVSGAPGAALFWKPFGGALQVAVALGDPAPGLGTGWTISSLNGQNSGPPHFNNNGVFVVSGGALHSPSGQNSAGVWRGAPGALQLLAKRGDTAAGHPNPNAQFNDFTPLINRAGAVIFASNLVNGGAQNSGIWIAGPSQAPELLTLIPAQAPDMPAGTMITSISTGGIGFNNRGEGLVNAALNYAVNSTPANGLFAGRPGAARFRKVVASGDNLEVSPGVFRTVFNIQCWLYNSPDCGRQVSINDRGEVAFSCQFVGGGGGMFLAQLPHPCPGDATGDDVVDFVDLNLILSQFGMVGPGLSGDLNGDGTVDFLDLNSVLSFFGAAC